MEVIFLWHVSQERLPGCLDCILYFCVYPWFTTYKQSASKYFASSQIVSTSKGMTWIFKCQPKSVCQCLFFLSLLFLHCTVRCWSLSQLSWEEVMVTPWAGRPGPQPSTLTFPPTDTLEVPIRVGNQPNVNDCGRKPQEPTKTQGEHATSPPPPAHSHTHTHTQSKSRAGI